MQRSYRMVMDSQDKPRPIVYQGKSINSLSKKELIDALTKTIDLFYNLRDQHLRIVRSLKDPQGSQKPSTKTDKGECPKFGQ